MSDADEFVIAHQAGNPAEAELILSLLKGAGLSAIIPDSNTPFPGVDLTPYTRPGGAGCDVFVPKKELKEAERVLKEARTAPQEDDSAPD